MSPLTEAEPKEAAAPPVVPRRRWLAPLFFLAGLGLLPWTAYLILTLLLCDAWFDVLGSHRAGSD